MTKIEHEHVHEDEEGRARGTRDDDDRRPVPLEVRSDRAAVMPFRGGRGGCRGGGGGCRGGGGGCRGGLSPCRVGYAGELAPAAGGDAAFLGAVFGPSTCRVPGPGVRRAMIFVASCASSKPRP